MFKSGLGRSLYLYADLQILNKVPIDHIVKLRNVESLVPKNIQLVNK